MLQCIYISRYSIILINYKSLLNVRLITLPVNIPVSFYTLKSWLHMCYLIVLEKKIQSSLNTH